MYWKFCTHFGSNFTLLPRPLKEDEGPAKVSNPWTFRRRQRQYFPTFWAKQETSLAKCRLTLRGFKVVGKRTELDRETKAYLNNFHYEYACRKVMGAKNSPFFPSREKFHTVV